jgi:hypothetical protein
MARLQKRVERLYDDGFIAVRERGVQVRCELFAKIAPSGPEQIEAWDEENAGWFEVSVTIQGCLYYTCGKADELIEKAGVSPDALRIAAEMQKAG